MGCLTIVAVMGLITTGIATAARAVPGAAAQPGAVQQSTAVVHGVWGKGQLVPGIAALNAAGNAAVTAISCTGPGYCTAGGYYTAARAPAPSGTRRAFVATEVKGHWGTAIQVPGTGVHGWAAVTSVACTSPGNCVAGGYDGIASSSRAGVGNLSYGFVASEVNGHWNPAHRLKTGQLDESTVITSVSCSRAGECLAGGYTEYLLLFDPSKGYPMGREIVADEHNHSWGSLRSLNSDALQYTTPTSVACASPGNCAAGVVAVEAPVVAQEARGTWHKATVPGFPAGYFNFNQGLVTNVACPKAGDCTAGGAYDTSGVWVASESGYRWGKAVKLRLGLGGVTGTTVNAISCTAPGYCTLAGQVQAATAYGFTATETAGHWSGARLVIFGTSANVPSVSCPALGYCVAAAGKAGYTPHVIEETGGTWGRLLPLPGLTHGGLVNSVSCAKPGWCAAGGSYSLSGQTQAIVADEA